MAVPAFIFVSAFKALLPIALGFAAGCMVWMVFAELLPDALEGASHAKVQQSGIVASTHPVLCFQMFAHCSLIWQC